jgi:GAF domain-containing protein
MRKRDFDVLRIRRMAHTTLELPLADELAAVWTRMSGLLLSREKVTTALKLITALAAEIFPDTAGAGVTLLDEKGRRITAAATDSLTERADAVQYELGVGPCLSAWEHRTVVRVDDIRGDRRWPAWGAKVAGGRRSVLSAPLVAGEDALGALKVYARHPSAYGDRETHLLTMFAAQAAILVDNMKSPDDAQRISRRLRENFRNRDAIALAKGIIMARDGTQEHMAFLILADRAQREHRSVLEVAERLVRSTVRAHR